MLFGSGLAQQELFGLGTLGDVVEAAPVAYPGGVRQYRNLTIDPAIAATLTAAATRGGTVLVIKCTETFTLNGTLDGNGAGRVGAGAGAAVAGDGVGNNGTNGIGEGLAINDESIYVILDNNAIARAGHPDDKRPWLFAFRNVIKP